MLLVLRPAQVKSCLLAKDELERLRFRVPVDVFFQLKLIWRSRRKSMVSEVRLVCL